ncbi:MAG: sugar nucleotide-binding protein [Flavisolibacter sp.]|nr:sugar nucleotide-binding protein [Flavisolibacter sp.]
MLTDKKIPLCNPEVWGGIECTINRVNDNYLDQLRISNFYHQPYITTIADLGIKKIRFPILWEKHQPDSGGLIDWTWTQTQLKLLQEKEVEVIAGLIHHGSGPEFTNLTHENFPELFAKYAGEVAKKFPWIEYYTPVNEPLTTARFSGLYGVWYPHAKDAKSFMLMLLNQIKAVVLAMQEIRKINPNAKLIQTEDLGKVYSTRKLKYQADFENERRWLTYDLLCGLVDEKHKLWNYLIWLGIPATTLYFFIENTCTPDVFGFNHYVTSERFIDDDLKKYPSHTHGGNGRHTYADVEVVRVKLNEEIGIKSLLREAWERYQKPIAVTEVHLHCHREEQLRWFKYVWNSCTELTNEGVDIRAVTAWALFGSYGWNKLLTVDNGDYEPGVFDIRSGTPRPTALSGFLKELTSTNNSTNQLLKIEGWWQRDCRYIYDPVISQMQVVKNKLKMRPLLIIGKRGTLGKAFARACEKRALPYRLLSRQDCDIADLGSIESAIDLYKPWAIINAAGYVRVDDAEKEEAQCYRENQCGPLNLAYSCKKHVIKLVNFSSDLVFDGKKETPYVESDEVNPLNVYGRSKALSEQQVKDADPYALIIRTSAFFSPSDQYNFIHWVENNILNQQEITVANDVVISPTYVPDLVDATLDLLVDGEKGLWHLSNKGSLTWADLAMETARIYDCSTSLVNAVPVKEMNLPAARPLYTVLGSEKGAVMPYLDHALQRYFHEKKQFVEW